MKTYRQVVLLVYCAAVFVVCVYPPWKVSFGALRFNTWYYLLWNPPRFYEGDKRYDAVVDLARVGLELVAVTALAGFLLLLGEVGHRLRSSVTLPSWITKKVVLPVILLVLLGGWGLHVYWHEQRRIQQVAEQKAICDRLSVQCAERQARKAKEGRTITIEEYLRGMACGGDHALLQEYSECQDKVYALQTEQE